MIRLLLCLFLVWSYGTAADPVSAKLASEAEQARKSGQIVRAYLLYSEAAAREPNNSTYAANRDALAPAAKLLTQAHVQEANVSEDVRAAEEANKNTPPPVEIASLKDWNRDPHLASIPTVHPADSPRNFELHGDERSLFQEVAAAYGMRVTFDPQLDTRSNIRYTIENADFRTALEALTALTGTFVFPISDREIFVARDTEDKRNQLEPQLLLTFPLPNALDQRDVVDAANAVRGVLTSRAVGWDTTNRTVMVRDRASRARIAYSLLQAILLPKAQVSFELQLLTVDTERNYHYGLALPTSFQIAYFGKLTGFQTILPMFSTAMNFLTFGGGSTLFGIGLTNTKLFATYSKSISHNIFDATIVVGDGQTANFHVGEQYPIPQAISSVSTQSPSIYNPIGQVQMVDLGILLKLTPRVGGDGSMAIDVEAEFKQLGTQIFNTVPAILQRKFKSTVNVREGESAVLAGLDADTQNVTRNGLIGLSQIPGLNHVLAENTRDTQTSNTLIVINPTITRLPMSASISPQFLFGPSHGPRVLL